MGIDQVAGASNASRGGKRPSNFLFLGVGALVFFNILLWTFVGWHPLSFLGAHQQDAANRDGVGHHNHTQNLPPSGDAESITAISNWEVHHEAAEKVHEAEEYHAKEVAKDFDHVKGHDKKVKKPKLNGKKKKKGDSHVVATEVPVSNGDGVVQTTAIPTIALDAMEEGPYAGDGAEWQVVAEGEVPYLGVTPPFAIQKGETAAPLLHLSPTEEEDRLKSRVKDPDGMQWVGKKKPRVRLYTDYGSMLWELEPGYAPKTVKNFLYNCGPHGYMNKSSCFYRYERGFVLQGGACGGNSGKNVPLEYGLPNDKNTIALARAGSNLNSGGSEWFINLANNSRGLGPGRKGGYAVFARIISGFNTMNLLKKLPTKGGGKHSLTKFVSPPPKIRRVMVFTGDESDTA